MLKFLIFFLTFLSVESCSDLFKYYTGDHGVYGEVQIANIQLQQKLQFEIKLSVAAVIQNKQYGKVTLLNSDVYNDLLAQRSLRYKVDLASQNPLPVATAIILNNQQICSGPPARGTYISTIRLYHTYTMNYIPPSQPIPSSQPIPPLQPTLVPTLSPNLHKVQENTPQPIVQQPVSVIPAIPSRFSDSVSTTSNQCGMPKLGNQQQSSFIIGGHEAQRGQFPWLVAFYDTNAGFICGGTLISKKSVISAAHCVHNKGTYSARKPENTILYMGKHNINSLTEVGYITSRVQQFFLHPDWKPSSTDYRGDVSFAVLSQSVDFSNYIQPLCVWPKSNTHADLVGQNGIIAGWGITEKGVVSDVPKFIRLPVVDDSTCFRSDSTFLKITSETNFCVGDKSGNGPCQGDSGGAFIVKSKNDNKFYLRGIVSAGIVDVYYGTCNDREYVVFTDVAAYSDWIMNYNSLYGEF